MQYGFFLGCYVLLWCLFFLLMLALGRPWPGVPPGMDILLLSLAAFRLTEILSEEKVARCIRAPFCEVRRSPGPDGTEIEEEVPMGAGIQRVAGELLLCPWCTGVWMATFLTFFYLLVPGMARVILIAFSVAAGGLLFQILIKLLDRTRKALPASPSERTHG